MLSENLIITISFLYFGLLFAIAYWADRRADSDRSVIANPTVYALSLAVYCTAWTYYGSVGRAAETGIGFLPIYLGPTLAATLWVFVLLKMVRVSKAQRITSIADFISSRYGKSHLLGGLVTIIALVGVLPYIALQLKAISHSFAILSQYPEIISPGFLDNQPVWSDKTFYIALMLAVFIVLFGTRHLDASERHEGMVAAIAFESIIKLVALTTVGVFITFVLYDGFGDVVQQSLQAGLLQPKLFAEGSANTWVSFSLLSALAVLTLPRQFQVAVVENSDETHLSRAIWLFPLYLLLINLFVLPIALAGQLEFTNMDVDADTYVLTLPIAHQQEWLALFAYLGGLSAATGMVIVETIALSTMICNDLVMPGLLRRWRQQVPAMDLNRILLFVRRTAIFVVLMLGYSYYKLAGEAYALVAIGLISFTAVAQFAPAMIGGLYWRGGTRNGALAGLSAGFVVWLYTLLLPSFAKSGWLGREFIDSGIFGWSLLNPQALFGLEGLDEISHCLFWSMVFNIGAYLIVSSWRTPNADETTQATLFVDAMKHDHPLSKGLWRGRAEIADLANLTERFLGKQRASMIFAEYFSNTNKPGTATELPADAEMVGRVEKLLAGAIGSASARVMVASVVEEEPLGIDEVMDILDEASQIRAYSHELEKKSNQLETATAELRSANSKLKELDHLKDSFMSSVTHELRTPLTSIRAFSEILQEDPKIELHERRRFLGIIVSETERLTRLVNQVLDLAKIESGQAVWKNTQVDLAAVVRSSVEASEQLVKDRGGKLLLTISDAPASVWADQDRLMQVMLNLLSNAAKFMAEQAGEIDIRLRRRGDKYQVKVADNGAGIAVGERAVIFDKFRQSAATMSNVQGTGLGLPISREIIEHCGGRLAVKSSLGKGSIFLFELPCSNHQPSSSPGTSGSGQEAEL